MQLFPFFVFTALLASARALLSVNHARKLNSIDIRAPLLTLGAASADLDLDPAAPELPEVSPSVVASVGSGDRSSILSARPNGDELDNRIMTLAIPAIVNFAIVPLVGAVDTVFVGRMKNALALAGQGAANQVFSSTFWIISFLPSVVTPLIAQAVGSGDKDAVQDRGMYIMVLLYAKLENRG